MTLKNVKVGDVIGCNARWGACATFNKVVRVTATQAICEGGERFLLKTGALFGDGDSWERRYGYIATEQDIAEFRMKKRILVAAKKLSNLKVTSENIDAVEVLLNESKS